MKKVIDNKIYNTKTSQEVGEYWNGYGSSDFHCIREMLYITRQGAWFIHAKGGALTKYADSHGNSSSEGETIIPLSPQEALEWLSRHNPVEAIEKHFADQISEA